MYAAYILHSIAAYVERVGGFLYCQTLLLLENLQMLTAVGNKQYFAQLSDTIAASNLL